MGRWILAIPAQQQPINDKKQPVRHFGSQANESQNPGKPNKSKRHKGGDIQGSQTGQSGESLETTERRWSGISRETKAPQDADTLPLQVMYPSRINSGAGLQLVNRYRFLFQRFRWGGIEVGEATDPHSTNG